MRLLEFEDQIYHVTHTKSVPSIMKKGVLPLQKSNWVRAGSKERYGEGEIFAFTNKTDALRWAAKMDWDFNKTIGSGKISILTIANGQDWDIDDADPLSQTTNKGKWLKSRKRIRPEQIIKAEPVTLEMTRSLIH